MSSLLFNFDTFLTLFRKKNAHFRIFRLFSEIPLVIQAKKTQKTPKIWPFLTNFCHFLSILIIFECFEPIWAKLYPFTPNLYPFRMFLNVLSQFWMFWANLSQFTPFWTNFEPIWTNLHHFGPLLTGFAISDQFASIFLADFHRFLIKMWQ